MKNSSLFYLIVPMVLIAGVMSIIFYSCEKEEIRPLTQTTDNTVKSGDEGKTTDGYIPPENYCGEIMYNVILDQEGREVGQSYAFNDAHFFYLLLIANDDYAIKDAFLHVANDFAEIPLDTEGNPVFTEFEYLIKDEEEAPRREFKIPIKELSASSTITAAALFRYRESDPGKYITVWAGERAYGNTAFGRLFTYRKGICLIDQPVQDLVVE